jgi:hypothetical protein
MIDLLAASAIMRSKVFMHRWLIMGKGQNVKNQNVESPKRTSKDQKEHPKSKKNIQSPKRTSKVQKEHQKSERRKSFLDF